MVPQRHHQNEPYNPLLSRPVLSNHTGIFHRRIAISTGSENIVSCVKSSISHKLYAVEVQL